MKLGENSRFSSAGIQWVVFIALRKKVPRIFASLFKKIRSDTDNYTVKKLAQNLGYIECIDGAGMGKITYYNLYISTHMIRFRKDEDEQRDQQFPMLTHGVSFYLVIN